MTSIARPVSRLAVSALLCLALVACGDDTTNPSPAIFGASPDSIEMNAGVIAVTIAGEDFVEESQARLGTTDLPTEFVDARHLLVELSAAITAEVGWKLITVTNPPPGGGKSGVDTVVVAYPIPVLDSISPDSVAEGTVADSVMVFGQHLYAGVFTWDGTGGDYFVPISPTQAKIYINNGRRAAGGVFNVQLLPFDPGMGPSVVRPFTVVRPTPVISSLSPATAPNDVDSVRLRVYGTGLRPVSKIHFGATELTTQWVNNTELRATVPAVALATPAIRSVTVVTPAPGGGTSVGSDFAVTQAPPRFVTMVPVSVTSGAGDLQVTITGSGFTAASVVRVDAVDRSTSYISPTEVKVTVPAGDLAAVGSRVITIHEPSTGLSSIPLPFFVLGGAPAITDLDSLPLAATDLIADTGRGSIWAAIGSSAASRAGQVVRIDGATGEIVDSLLGLGDPQVLALSDDGSRLYVGVGDAPSIIRVDLPGGGRTTISLPALGGPIRAEEIVVAPEDHDRILVTTKNLEISPRNSGTFVFDGATQLPASGPGHTGSNQIARGEDLGVYFGVNSESTEFGVRRLRMIETGVVEEQVVAGLAMGFGDGIESGLGRLYLTDGVVISQATLTQVGTIPVSGSLTVDEGGGRVHVVADGMLRTYHATALTLVGSVTDGAFTGASDPVRWGSDGLAVRKATKVYLFRSSMVGP